LLTVRNVTEQGVVARVVVRSGENGSELLVSNLFMSPNDTWVAAAFWDEALAAATFATNDMTCIDADRLPQSPDVIGVLPTGQTWVEIYLLGALSAEDKDRYTFDGDNSSPCPDQFDSNQIEITPIADALSGDAQLINVGQGQSLAVPPIGLSDFALIDEPTSLSELSTLTLASGNSTRTRIDSTTLDFGTSLDAVSAALMIQSATISYSVEDVVNGRAHLLLTLPTRHLHDASSTLFVNNTGPVEANYGWLNRLALTRPIIFRI